MEFSKVYRDESGCEAEIKIKTECATEEDMRQVLSFIARSSHNFYLQAADKIKAEIEGVKV